MKRACILLAALALTLCAGCTSGTDPVPETGTAPAASASSSLPPSEEPSAEPSVPELPQGEIQTSELDGVYRNDTGMIVIRNVQVGSCSFIADARDGGGGYLSGVLERDDNTLTCYTDAMLLTILVGDGTLTVSETALSPYWESTDKLAGTYTKTGEDPYSIPLDETYGGASSSLPDSIRDTVIDGKSVSVYLDPQGRFSAVFPSLFYAAPAGQQPEDGVSLVGDAENAKLTVEAQPLGSAVTAGDYMEYLRQQFVSCSVEQQEDGLIRLTRTFFDDNTTEWEEIALFHLAGEEIYKIDFVFIAADAASYEPMAENMYFIFN